MRNLLKSLMLAMSLGACGLASAEPLSLSINFAGGRKNAEPYGDVTGPDYYGAHSIPGDSWNNVRAYNNTALGDLVWSDGVTRSGVTLTTVAGCNWTTGVAKGIFYSYLDSGNNTPAITIAGLTPANGFPSNVACTVYVYVTTDSASYKLYATKINDVQYTGGSFTTTAGTAAWGLSDLGKNGVLQEGGDYLRVTGVTPDTNGTIRVVSNQSMPSYRGGVSAVQLVFDQPGVTASCRAGEGTVAVDGGTGAVKVGKNGDFGTSVTATLTATPAAHYAFAGWTGDTDAITTGSASDAAITVTADAAKHLTATFEPVSDRREIVLSVNFAGGTKYDGLTNPITGETTHGHFPVAGYLWNNLSNHLDTAIVNLPWNFGDAVKGVTLTYESKWNYTVGTSHSTAVGSLFYSYLEDYNTDSGVNPYVEFGGLTAANGLAETCTVCAYFSSDNANVAFAAPTVNGMRYTYADGRTVKGTNAWGTVTRSHNGTEVEGGNYLVIGDVPVQDGKVRLSSIFQGNGVRASLAAVQLVFNISRTVTVQAATQDATQGLVQFGDATAAETASTSADDSLTATLRAVPQAGFVFYKWHGDVEAIASGTINDAEVTVSTKMPKALTAEFVADTVVASATWIGGGDRANASDPANWDCRTGSGTQLVDALPTTDTEIVVAGDTTFNLPAGQSFLSRTFTIGNCRLTADCDWRGFGKSLTINGTVDLNGHKLWVSGLTGTGTITDRKGEPDDAATLSINFNGTRSSKAATVESRGTVSGTTTYGAVPVAGANWNNIAQKDTVDLGGLIWNDGTAATGLALTAGNNGVVYTTGTTASEGTLFYSYLDDALAYVKVSGLTTANGIISDTCTVYVYMSSDVGSRKFKAVTVNGTTYTYSETVSAGTGDWGSSDYSRNGQLVRGGNYLEIENVPIPTSGRIEIAPLKTDNASVARGGVAAVQIAGLRRTASAMTGELHVDVASGETLANTTVTLDGALKLVKDGAGTFVATKASQSYAGGTEVAVGNLTLGTATAPLGTGTGIRSVQVDAGATFDYGGKMSSTASCYNFTLDGGTLRLVGSAQNASWNSSYASLASLTLTADSKMTGKFFYFGNPSGLPITFNGHRLDLDLEGYIFQLGAQAADAGILSYTNGGFMEVGANCDLSRTDVRYSANVYAHLSVSCPVGDFSYAHTKWAKHASATWFKVGGTYHVGTNRPPLDLLDGATLDFTDWPVNTVWDSTGVAAATTGNNTTYSQPGLVSFATNATYTVAVGMKVYPHETTKLINWSAAPADTTFELDPVARKRNVLRVKDDGLYILNVNGLIIILQ